MKLCSIVRRFVLLSALAAGMTGLDSCVNMIYDGEGDCSVNCLVKFRYDYNMLYADAFAHEVNTVTLYLIDGDGRVVWQNTESGEALASEDYAMKVEVDPGTYSLLAWAGTSDKGSFEFGESDLGTGLTCTVNRERGTDESAYVDKDLDRLFHGWLENQEFSGTEGTYTYTVPLVKNTNNIRILLQHTTDEELDASKFEFKITDNNGSMDWDNSVVEDEYIDYYAWYTESVSADFGSEDDGIGGNSLTRTGSFNGAVAELTVPRLMVDHDPRLVVTNIEENEVVMSIPLVQMALLVKGYYNRNMDDQEYLDRQDTYDFVFFLDNGDRWINSYIYVNSWLVVLQDVGL